jgi:hypothetical protein
VISRALSGAAAASWRNTGGYPSARLQSLRSPSVRAAAGEFACELPGRLEAFDHPLLVRAHDEKSIAPEARHAHVVDTQERRVGVRLPGCGRAVHRGSVASGVEPSQVVGWTALTKRPRTACNGRGHGKEV